VCVVDTGLECGKCSGQLALIWYEMYKMREALNTADRKVYVKGKEILSRASMKA
jgi:hypothetical protein